MFFILFCCGISVNAENIPFVQDGKRWNYIGYLSGVAPENERAWEYSYYLQGDTVVGGIPCLKLFYEGGKNNVSEDYWGAMYEEDGKVYFIPKGKDVPTLLYDFRCQLGDELDTFGGMVTVENIKSVGYQAKEYRVITVQDRGTWIEGVGSIYDLFTLTLPDPGEWRSRR